MSHRSRFLLFKPSSSRRHSGRALAAWLLLGCLALVSMGAAGQARTCCKSTVCSGLRRLPRRQRRRRRRLSAAGGHRCTVPARAARGLRFRPAQEPCHAADRAGADRSSSAMSWPRSMPHGRNPVRRRMSSPRRRPRSGHGSPPAAAGRTTCLPVPSATDPAASASAGTSRRWPASPRPISSSNCRPGATSERPARSARSDADRRAQAQRCRDQGGQRLLRQAAGAGGRDAGATGTEGGTMSSRSYAQRHWPGFRASRSSPG